MARTATPPRIDAGSDEAAFDAWFSRHADELRSFSTRMCQASACVDETPIENEVKL